MTLPSADSDLARGLFRDHYVLEVSGLQGRVRERDVEIALLARMRSFFLALGTGFSLVGSQYPLSVGGQDFYVDLLFYQTLLGRYVVADLKTRAFQPSYVGQMGFYLTAVDERLPNPAGPRESIGIILCKSQNATVVEYALRRAGSPMGVATYETIEALPADLQRGLPSPRALQAEYDAALADVASDEHRP